MQPSRHHPDRNVTERWSNGTHQIEVYTTYAWSPGEGVVHVGRAGELGPGRYLRNAEAVRAEIDKRKAELGGKWTLELEQTYDEAIKAR